MASKTKEKQQAPPILYVTIDEAGTAQYHYDNPDDAEEGRDAESERIARYKFDGFVAVEFVAIVTDDK